MDPTGPVARRFPLVARPRPACTPLPQRVADLRTRGGAAAHHLDTAVAPRIDTAIDGVEIPTARLTSPPEAHRELRTWLWTVLLSDGARALAVAGRWHKAHQRLKQYKGIGHRMLDGRQIAVIAHATAGHHDKAQALLHTTQPGQPWETAVTACLTLLCQPHPTASTDRSDALANYRGLDTTAAGLTVFHTRLGLCLIDALDTANQPATEAIAASLLDQATTDGYAARDVLAHPSCRGTATNRQTHALAELVDACGLDSGRIPEPMLADISATLHTAEQVISHRPRTELGTSCTAVCRGSHERTGTNRGTNRPELLR
jgi:hypothetical protein